MPTARPWDRSDQGPGSARDRLHEPRNIPFALEGAGSDGGKFADIVAGREHVAFATDHDRSCGLIRFRGYDCVGERAVHDICHRVLLVGPRECQRQDVFCILYLDLLKRRTRFAHQDAGAASQHELTLFSFHVKYLSRAIAIVTQNSYASRQARLLPSFDFRGISSFDPGPHPSRRSPQQWPGEGNRVKYGSLHHFDAKIPPMMLMSVNPRFEGTREAPSGFVSVAPGGPLNRSLR